MHQDVQRHLQAGKLVCPLTRQRLAEGKDVVSTPTTQYEVRGGVPILISDRSLMDEYAKESASMNVDYARQKPASWFSRLRQRDYRTKASLLAMERLFDNLPAEAVCLSVGGGPTRAHPRLVNLNIGTFPNVDVVGDAHRLPYADGSVDVLYCDAVFEHLHSPMVAAAEVTRVMKSGGMVFVCTPFLQPYHGYPHHYQNYTLTGHTRLFNTAGLKVIEAGTCVGPVFVLRNIIGTFFHAYLPRPLNRIASALWSVASMLIAPLDLVLAKTPNAYVMASTTYLVATKD